MGIVSSCSAVMPHHPAGQAPPPRRPARGWVHGRGPGPPVRSSCSVRACPWRCGPVRPTGPGPPHLSPEQLRGVRVQHQEDERRRQHGVDREVRDDLRDEGKGAQREVRDSAQASAQPSTTPC